MEFGTFKIDLNALAALITAITAAYFTIKGAKQQTKHKKKKEGKSTDV